MSPRSGRYASYLLDLLDAWPYSHTERLPSRGAAENAFWSNAGAPFLLVRRSCATRPLPAPEDRPWYSVIYDKKKRKRVAVPFVSSDPTSHTEAQMHAGMRWVDYDD